MLFERYDDAGNLLESYDTSTGFETIEINQRGETIMRGGPIAPIFITGPDGTENPFILSPNRSIQNVAPGNRIISIDMPQADASSDGWLSAADWTYFNGKLDNNQYAKADSTTFGIASFPAAYFTDDGSGLISPTLAKANNSTPPLGGFPDGDYGVATFFQDDFTSDTGVIGLNYLNGQKANGSQSGFLSSTDFSTFSNKQDLLTLTTTGTSGPATLTGSTLNIPQYTGGGGGVTTATATALAIALG